MPYFWASRRSFLVGQQFVLVLQSARRQNIGFFDVIAMRLLLFTHTYFSYISRASDIAHTRTQHIT